MNHMGFPLDPKPAKTGKQKGLLANINKVGHVHNCGAEHDASNASSDHPRLLRQLQATTNLKRNHDQMKVRPSSRALSAIGFGANKSQVDLNLSLEK